MSRIFAAILLACGVGVAAPALAANPVRVSGTIEQVQGSALTVAEANGDKVVVTLSDDAKVFLIVPVKPADIKAGAFIGAGAVKGSDGLLHARSVFVFPEAQRGLGEGQRAWNVMPGGVMTNATIAEVAAAPSGQTISLTYKGGTAEIAIDPDTAITTAEPADRSILQAGRTASLFATPAADGSLTAASVRVDADGVKPAP